MIFNIMSSIDRIEQTQELDAFMQGYLSNFSRELKRKLEMPVRHAMEGNFLKLSRQHIQPVISVDTILTEYDDDTSLFQRELGLYERAQATDRAKLGLYHVYRSMGIPDNDLRDFFANPSFDPYTYGKIMGQIPFNRMSQAMGLTTTYVNELFRPDAIVDDEDANDLSAQLQKADLGMEEILMEILRARQESIGLIKLQMEILVKEQQPNYETDNSSVDEVVELDAPNSVIPIGTEEVVEDYILSPWEIQWTTRYWSTNPTYLVPLPTQSRETMIGAIEQLGRGVISIKPLSVVRAIEFHVGKNVIQRALAMRNRHTLGDSGDWIKLKRGDDRIGLLLPDPDEQKAIVFAGGRDVVYRTL